MTSKYIGFSSNSWPFRKTLRLAGTELVNQDLMNHIFTEKGERLHMPNFGTRIPSLTFEQNDEIVRDIIQQDLKEVFAYDPRVSLISLQIYTLPDNNAVIASAELRYVELGVVDTLKIEIKR